MDTMQCMLSRRSIRKFKKVPVEWSKIARICEAGLAAPTAGNLQDFRLLVVTDEGKKNKIAHFCADQLWMANAAVYIVVNSIYVKTQRFYGVRGERLYSIQSAAAGVQNMLLAAHSMGLGACWIGAFDEDNIKNVLSVPGYARVQAVIPIGYPDEIVPMPPKFGTEQMVHLNRFADNSGKVWSVRKEMLKEWSPVTEEAVESLQKNSKNLMAKIGEHARKLQENIKKKVSGK